MANPTDRKYSNEHEWVKLEGDVAIVGITDYAQEQLTDIVFVELPEVGRQVKAGDSAAVLESVKSVADVYAPCDGEVADVNSSLEDHPEKVNDDAYGAGWIFKLKTSGPDLSALMEADAYQAFVDAEG
ncbi:MAG: glycine cleavage system protein GcvH [SAR324 cluster bacterium]|nr:glycine cleavage system protein GcvH [SAR324 cluster bacterium]MCZ6627035.1 glycine cleavage system protein GcvH [SAR324 cluster bacterium]MCZ6646440.1 glycine cleavage system protein GcvH [SAR324 cluster bacterium]MCZ6843288.1 glycine cleavage system protein GcvH [SAR324 cluster bacterium]